MLWTQTQQQQKQQQRIPGLPIRPSGPYLVLLTPGSVSLLAGQGRLVLRGWGGAEESGAEAQAGLRASRKHPKLSQETLTTATAMLEFQQPTTAASQTDQCKQQCACVHGKRVRRKRGKTPIQLQPCDARLISERENEGDEEDWRKLPRFFSFFLNNILISLYFLKDGTY